MAFLYILNWAEKLETRVPAIALWLLVPSIFCSMVAVTLGLTSYLMANVSDLPIPSYWLALRIDEPSHKVNMLIYAVPPESRSIPSTQKLHLDLIPAV